LPVRADRSRFEQVIVNLATNGRDAMPRGGVLTLQTKRVNPAEIVDLGRPVPFGGGAVLIRVSDVGGGIAPDIQGRVFDPFFTTKPFGQGAGLGLSSVFGTVRQSGGDVWMSSDPGKGATAWVLLPISTNTSGAGNHARSRLSAG
jgi:two-component system cell cycle sensor histidine kinase/response regulator CckA